MNSPLFELAHVLLRFDHAARFIVNVDEKLAAFVEVELAIRAASCRT